MRSAPVSRILFPQGAMTISLGRALPSASMRRGSFGRAVPKIERSCFRWGLPECASPRDSVSSYLTISPLRGLQGSPRGMFLWHFPSSCPDRTLSCTLPYEARTFLTLYRLSSMKARSSSVLRAASIPPLDNLGRIDQTRPGPA